MDKTAQQRICEEIQEIMQTYREQEKSAYGVDTPGGLEHMGDVWRLLGKWDTELASTSASPGPPELAMVHDWAVGYLRANDHDPKKKANLNWNDVASWIAAFSVTVGFEHLRCYLQVASPVPAPARVGYRRPRQLKRVSNLFLEKDSK